MKFFLFLLITFINLGCSHSLLDSKVEYKTPVQEGYERYFNKNKNSLDPIEGIWMEYAVGILYGEDRKVIKRELNPKRASWIVIKKDNEFKVLDINGKQNFFNATFAPTNKNRVYQFKCLIYDTKDQLISLAELVEPDRLEMAYNAPKGLFNNIYNSKVSDNEKDLDLYWEIQWLRSSPSKY